jgi:hypothetical protein
MNDRTIFPGAGKKAGKNKKSGSRSRQEEVAASSKKAGRTKTWGARGGSADVQNWRGLRELAGNAMEKAISRSEFSPRCLFSVPLRQRVDIQPMK